MIVLIIYSSAQNSILRISIIIYSYPYNRCRPIKIYRDRIATTATNLYTQKYYDDVFSPRPSQWSRFKVKPYTMDADNVNR